MVFAEHCKDRQNRSGTRSIVWGINAPMEWKQDLTFTKRHRGVVFAGDPADADIAGWDDDFVNP